MRIRNIIFDLGGVLLNIEYDRTVDAFKKLGLKEPEKAFTKEVQAGIFQKFEKGQISSREFVNVLSKHMLGASQAQIVDAWNALLGDFPIERYHFLSQLAEKYQLFVLSNTNAIHETAFQKIIEKSVGWEKFKSLFAGIAYSHNLGERKPNPEIFLKVLSINEISADETIFIDDTKEHVESASKLGIKSLHLENESLQDCLTRNLRLT
ncbi:MAG: HAD family hydrolase [Cryomorphaceae bacterium]|nr:HAD family phosphatase [Flavobacteriales bacterium]